MKFNRISSQQISHYIHLASRCTQIQGKLSTKLGSVDHVITADETEDMAIESQWLNWTWTLAELFNHVESETVITLINQLRMQISGEFNTDELFQKLVNLKDQAMVLDHWTFTSPGLMIVIALILMITGLCIWKNCCQ
jgi:hypothetical protein